MPRGLAGRIWLAVAAVALVGLVATGAGLFVALRDAHREATKASLAALIAPLQLQLRRAGNGGITADDVSALQAAVGQDIDVLVFLPLRMFGSEARRPSDAVLAQITSDIPTTGEYADASGVRYVFAGIRFGGAAAVRRLVVIERDEAGAVALGEVLRTLPAVVLITLLAGGSLAWLLARSVRDPLRRLARATADVPASRASPVPLGGPTEVRELAGRFNAMIGELEATRHREDELLANLRHDLRTPVTVIGGYAAALADGTASGPDALRAAQAIAEEAERLEGLVDELGAIERYAAGAASLRPEILDAGAVVVGARERFLARATAAGIELAVVTPEGVPDGPPAIDLAFAGDRVAVDRLVGNLVANALGPGRAGGHVWLEARSLTDASGRPAIAVLVTDDGPGFPPGTTGRVFERFFRADPARSGPGSGLGLAIVRELAEAHGGTAHAENIAPHGARVSVVLPVVPVIVEAQPTDR